MDMFYTSSDGTIVKYDFKCNPPEKMYWLTAKFKKSEIKILTKHPRERVAEYKQAIIDEINQEL